MKPKQILAVTKYNFRRWHKNPRIVITFCLAFVLCFLLSDKAVKFAKEYETTMQLVEAFVWTFGDSNSILLSSLLLLLLFADMPFISSATPFYLMRTDRKTWLTGQAAYIALATLIYLAFILVSTSLVCMRQSFVGDMWSETAAILGYSGAGQKVALPALVKTLEMSRPYETTMQLVEAFVWTFGDSNSILLSSLLLLLLFADMPFISSATPFYLMRTDRKTWLTGQAAYIALATLIYLAFILVSTSLVCMRQSFVGDMWSETAAILGYSGAGQKVALPALVKTLEMSRPYECMATIFLLMLLYTLLMVFVMLLFNLRRGQLAGIAAVFAFSLFGFLLNPQTIKAIFKLPDALMYKANVAVGWLSPLNQATYHMHNFGYDLLPRLWQTYFIFAMLIALCFFLSLRAVRNYNFNFGGTEA